MTPHFSIEKLGSSHYLDDFYCSSQALNRFLVRFALTSQQASSSQTYVGMADRAIAGFYTLAVGQVNFEDSPKRLTKGLAQYPVPIMLLARLAVSVDWQKRGVGAGLLKDAMRRTMQAADIAGIRAIAAHAKDDAAQQFYTHFNFIPSPTDPYHLFLLLKDVRRMYP